MNDINYENIWNLIHLRRYQLAKTQIASGFSQSPNDTELYYASAYIAWQLSDTEQGLAFTARGLQISPEHPSLLYVRFLLLEDNKSYQEAEDLIISLIRQHPANPDYFSAYARIMLFTFHLEKARELCNQALRIAPDHNDAKVVDLLLHITNGQLENSEKRIQELLHDNPDSQRHIRLLILILINKKHPKAALLLTQQLIRENPNDSALIELAIALRQETHWSAIPLRPLYRYGWPASIALWISFIGLVQIDKRIHLPGFRYVTIVYLIWIVYSWIHAPILSRWLKYRGI